MSEQEKELREEEETEEGIVKTGADAAADAKKQEQEPNAAGGNNTESDSEKAPAADEEEASDEEVIPDESDAEDETETHEGKKSWAERRAEKKAAKQDKKTDAMKEQIEQLEDKVKRQLAEFENFRNRTEKEKQIMFETGARSVIEKILPIVDNFERGFASVDPEDKNDAFVEGMNMVYRQLMTELDNLGVKPIEAVGKEFDPNLHNAVMQVESDEYESGIVAQELQKGYTYRDTVVRHSMVSVVQ